MTCCLITFGLLPPTSPFDYESELCNLMPGSGSHPPLSSYVLQLPPLLTGMASVFVSYGCGNKLPQSQWLKTTVIIF